MKISVIISIYNSEKYLAQCLDSIRNQTFTDFEVICINDGSTDRSEEIIKKYVKLDGRFTLVNKKNEHLGGAPGRNLGLDLAKGEYVSILDSDDFYDPKMYELAIKKAEKTNSDITIFNGYQYDERTKKKINCHFLLDQKYLPKKSVFNSSDINETILQISPGMAWNKLFRRSFIEQNKLRFERIVYTDDAFFTFTALLLAKRISYIKNKLCYYRINSGDSQTDRLNLCPDSCYVPYLTIKSYLESLGVYEKYKKTLINCAFSFFRYFYERITDFDAFLYLHNKLKTEVFNEFDAKSLKKNYFYEESIYNWVQDIERFNPGQILLNSLHCLGTFGATTAPIRLSFPLDIIPQSSRIIIFGSNYKTRCLLSFNMLRIEYYKIVRVINDSIPKKHRPFFVSNSDGLNKKDFDYAIVQYTSEKDIISAINVLIKLNISSEKVIFDCPNSTKYGAMLK